jgi:hypothetical protein
MANVELEAFNGLYEMLRDVSKVAVVAAEDAAAKVYRDAARAAAPVGKGQLRRSIKIVEGKLRGTLSMGVGLSTRGRLFVGPEKRTGFYGFFLEKGHKVSGPRRIKRGRSGSTHSQAGSAATGTVDARPWFEPAMIAAEPQAMEAFESAFNAKLDELNRKK